VSSCLSVDLNPPLEHIPCTNRLSIAIIGPDEQSRRLVASALRSSRRNEVFEFHSYPPKRGYLRAVMENQFNVLRLELDSNLDLALELVQEASEIRDAAILAYSKHADSKLTLECIDSGVLVYSIADGATEISQAIDRLAHAFFPEEESVSPKQSASSLTVVKNCQREDSWQLPPAVLPRDFDDWDDVRHPVEPHRFEEAADIPSADCALELSEAPFGFSGEQAWEPEHIVQNPNRDEMREMDETILHMFRRQAEETSEANRPRERKRIFATVSLAGVAILMISLVAWSRPALLANINQVVQNHPMVKVMQSRVTQTSANTKAPSAPSAMPGM